jgi:hypothetical protein
LFAEDIGLLADNLFTRLVDQTRQRPAEFAALLGQLFRTMATGGCFGVDQIEYFKGGLFADDQVLELTKDDLKILTDACRLDWASVEPSIFGTLFERSLDPAKRAQLGAHYTSREDILLIVEPVVVAPLRRRWVEVQQAAQVLLDKRRFMTGSERARHGRSAHQLLLKFADELAATRILDPAAGSGNFLYLALRRLLDLEKEAMSFGLVNGLNSWIPKVGPEQLRGTEINPYAHELAHASASCQPGLSQPPARTRAGRTGYQVMQSAWSLMRAITLARSWITRPYPSCHWSSDARDLQRSTTAQVVTSGWSLADPGPGCAILTA